MEFEPEAEDYESSLLEFFSSRLPGSIVRFVSATAPFAYPPQPTPTRPPPGQALKTIDLEWVRIFYHSILQPSFGTRPASLNWRFYFGLCDKGQSL